MINFNQYIGGRYEEKCFRINWLLALGLNNMLRGDENVMYLYITRMYYMSEWQVDEYAFFCK